MTTSTFHFNIVKLRACSNFNDNVLSINQKKMARDNTTPKLVLFKLSVDNNVGDLRRMANVIIRDHEKSLPLVFNKGPVKH